MKWREKSRERERSERKREEREKARVSGLARVPLFAGGRIGGGGCGSCFLFVSQHSYQIVILVGTRGLSIDNDARRSEFKPFARQD